MSPSKYYKHPTDWQEGETGEPPGFFPSLPQALSSGSKMTKSQKYTEKKMKEGLFYGQKENKCLCRVGVGTANKSSCNAHVHLVSGLNASDEHLTPA